MAEDMKITIHEASNNVTLQNQEKKGLGSLSLNPNNEDIIFIETKKNDENYKILYRYNLKTKNLYYYDLPKNFYYAEASYTKDGGHIILTRYALINSIPAKESEILLLDSGGSTLRTLPLPAGYKFSATISPNGQYVAYWRAQLRPEGSKTSFYKHDLYEYDLKNKSESLFQLKYEFFGTGKLSYFNNQNDTLLVDADTPTSRDIPGLTENNFGTWHSEFIKKYNNNQIYIIKRGVRLHMFPLLMKPSSAMYPSLDKYDNIFFFGDNPTVSFFSLKNNLIKQWNYPWKKIGYPRELQVTSEGKKIIYIFRYNQYDKYSSSLAIFDIEQDSYSELTLPNFSEAKPIKVNPD